ncbi:hypothetical protein TKK_0000482 [Trichogramma kaykai]|uniref:Peptidase S1 domain-containing protein n=1 Tax=Trichogramma kaykai TaxID=54128 RepID=A0ABD2WKK8_9HYME
MENVYRAIYSILILVFICGCYAGKLRIVDGDFVESIEEYPFQVSFHNNSIHICGGSILNKRYILTAAHCIRLSKDEELLKPELTSVRVGSLSKNSGGKVYQVEEFKINPFWGKFTMLPVYGDIALIKLKEDIEYNEKVQPVILPTGKNYSVPIGSTVTVVGYGFIKYHPVPTIDLDDENEFLRYTKMQVYDNKKCIKEYRDFIMSLYESEELRKQIIVNTRTICLKGDRHFCDTDSGGPVLDEHNVQVGVIQLNVDCGTGGGAAYPSGVTDLRPWLWWINQELSKEI